MEGKIDSDGMHREYGKEIFNIVYANLICARWRLTYWQYKAHICMNGEVPDTLRRGGCTTYQPTTSSPTDLSTELNKNKLTWSKANRTYLCGRWAFPSMSVHSLWNTKELQSNKTELPDHKDRRNAEIIHISAEYTNFKLLWRTEFSLIATTANFKLTSSNCL